MKLTILAGLAMTLPLVIQAADIKPIDVKPGLWQTTTKTEMNGAPMPSMPQIPEEALSRMPPEQRARVEAMMKSRNSQGGTTAKSCITREMLDKGMSFGRMDQNCTRNVISSSSDKMQLHVECTEKQTKSAGDVTIERLDSEHAKGTMDMKVTQGGGPPMNMKMSFETKYLGADCGDVKPPAVK